MNKTSAALIQSPLSGLIGMAWESLAETQALPFWQSLAQSSAWSSPEFGVYLQRWRGVSSAGQVESSGGELFLGGTDTGKYTGNVNYISIPSSNEDFWRIAVSGLTVQGSSVTIVRPQTS